MSVVIWSKDTCPYCDQAKHLLRSKGFEYEERRIGVDFNKEDLLAAIPTARTVPQIIINDVLIGGFTELRTHFEEGQHVNL
jgi:glutaredoxin